MCEDYGGKNPASGGTFCTSGRAWDCVMTLLLVWQFAQFSTVSDGKTGKPVVWFGYLQDVMFLIVVQCTVARVVNGHFDLAKTELID